MELRTLGQSDLQVSIIGLGCNNFGVRLDEDGTKAVVRKALDLGITFFDNAINYGSGRSEALLGKALGSRRKDVVLTTKFGTHPGGARDASRDFVMQSAEHSLKALGTDFIDLYQIHWPDPETPIEETLRALEDLVQQGKVRYVGCSNMPAWQMVEAKWTARTKDLPSFIACQDEYSLLARGAEQELIPAMAEYGLGLMPYSPLAAGMLTGKYRPGRPPPADGRLAKPGMYANKFLTDHHLQRAANLSAVAESHGLTLIDAALRWLAAQPVVSSIVAAAMTPEQLAANVQSVDGTLTPELIAALDETSLA